MPRFPQAAQLPGMTQRILVFAEAVTLAHVARPLALARILDSLGHHVIFACSPSAKRWLVMERRPFEAIHSIAPERFLHSLAHGSRLYDEATLKGYVEQDLALIERINPDAIIGDFRLTLYVSARLSRKPYGAIANAYWWPRHFIPGHAPDIPLMTVVGETAAELLYRATYPMVFRWHASPFARVCREFGIPPPPDGLLGAYTASDCTALADAEEFYPTRNRHNGSHRFIGPLEWSPRVALPPDHERWGRGSTLIYVNLGSSGPRDLLDRVLHALGDLDADVIAAAAGPVPSRAAPPNAIVFEYLPGAVLCKRAALVIGNGGSPIAYQALQAGVPILGLAANLDQFLNMRMVESLGAGRILRASSARREAILRAAREMLDNPAMRAAGRRASGILASYDAQERVATWIEALGIRRGSVAKSATAIFRDGTEDD
jgi:UDP:flavonoid glycosyltransferase YjiC (YdhE family)